MKRGAPWGVPGRQDDARAPRHVQGRTVPEGGDLVELRGAKPTAQDREPQESEERSELDRAEPLRRVRHLTARQGGVQLVDRHRDPSVAAEPLREADVVGVAVGEDERADIRGRPSHRRQLPGDVPVEAGHPRVDDRHLPRFLDEVRVDDALVAQSMDARSDLHRAEPPRARRPGSAGRSSSGTWRSRATSRPRDPTPRGVPRGGYVDSAVGRGHAVAVSLRAPRIFQSSIRPHPPARRRSSCRGGHRSGDRARERRDGRSSERSGSGSPAPRARPVDACGAAR